MNRALRVLKNSAALSLSVLLERGIALFLPLYVARVQGRQVWGHYSTALTFVTISASFAYWGLDQLLPREIARDRVRAGDFLANAGIVGGIASVLTTTIAIVIVHLLHYPPHVQYLIDIGIILTLFPRTEAILCEAMINGLEKMEWTAAVRFPITILRVACSAYLLSKGFGLEVLFIALAASHVLMCGIYLLLFKRLLPAFRLRFDRSLMRTLALQAIPFVTIIAIGETAKQADRVFLSKLWDTDSVGIYSVGIMLVQIMYMLAPAIMNALFPILSRAYVVSRRQFSSLISQIFKLLFVGIFPVTLTIISFADLAILLVFGPEYVSSITVLRIYALGIVPSFVARFLYRAILASNNEHLIIRVSFVNSVVGLALNIILIPRYGLLGASAAAVCTELVGLVQNLFYVSRRVGRFDFAHALLKPGACVLTSVLAYLGAMRWNLPVAWVSSIAVFAGTLLASRTVSWKDLSAIRPRTRKFDAQSGRQNENER
jgi:O-antigen/teichoic acid export membrane protein